MGSRKTNNRRFDGAIPVQWEIEGTYGGNKIVQARKPHQYGSFTVVHRTSRGTPQAIISREDVGEILVIPRGRKPGRFAEAIAVPRDEFKSEGFPYDNAHYARWIRPVLTTPTSFGIDALSKRASNVPDSWKQQFCFVEERGDVKGFRAPQLGALFSLLSHWTVSTDAATVVMPTGTGKTDTMLAAYAHQQFDRLLVVVPTDALREQTAQKFATLGWLKEFGILPSSAQYPIVGVIKRVFQDPDEAAAFIAACNVIVTTISLVAKAGEGFRQALSDGCGALFVDEAHHVPAPTWEKVRRDFSEKRVVQFTATPFRNDGKHVDGALVYRYPLSKAQSEGYFSNLRFRAIAEAIDGKADGAIARAAIEQVRADISNGFDHIVMARAATIERANALGRLYRQLAGDLGVAVLHSHLPIAERTRAMADLRAGRIRIAVCVDMLGEGVDVPSLKIAALHDPHRSLAITLQFIGRFARTRSNLGEATVIANVLNYYFEKSLTQLYSQDSDWNKLLSVFSEDETTRYAKREAFARGFEGGVPADIPMQNLRPKMSAVMYRGRSEEWYPERAADVFSAQDTLGGPFVNVGDHTIVAVTVSRLAVDWGLVRDIYDTIYDLHLVYWNANNRVLAIFSSDKAEFHDELATAVLGEEPELISGESMFRAISGINRLILTNLGLRHAVNRRIQFSMMMGNDIVAALTDAEQQNRVKSNLFGVGYEDGELTTIGCSRKGRVWSQKIANGIPEWIDWVNRVASKLLNDRITSESLLRHVIFPELATTRPSSVPIRVDWDPDLLRNGDDHVFVRAGEREYPFYEVSLTVVDYTDSGPLRFSVVADHLLATYEARFGPAGVEYIPTAQDIDIRQGRKEQSATEWFKKYPPEIYFSDGSFLMGRDLCRSRNAPRVPYDRDRIIAWTWDDINPSKESQTPERERDSIQWKVIQAMLAGEFGYEYGLVFDDDNPGESADIVAVRIEEHRAFVDLVHCKYAHAGVSARRIADLYEVCGQAQKSITWCRDLAKLFDHLRHRENLRVVRDQPTRFEVGDAVTLRQYAAVAPQVDVIYRVFLVQPGLSRARATEEQLDLLGSTATYLQETLGIDLAVVGAA